MAENMEGRPSNQDDWRATGKSYNETIQNINEEYLTSYPSSSGICFVHTAMKDPGYWDYTVTEYVNQDAPLSVAITFIDEHGETYRLCSQRDGSLGFMVTMAENMEGRPSNQDDWRATGKSYNETIQNINEEYLTSYPSSSGICFVHTAMKDPGYWDYTVTEYVNQDAPLSVAITFIDEHGETYRLCSQRDGSLGFMTGKLPEKIEGTECSFLFFKKKFAVGDDSYSFQCADGRGKYLSYNEHNQVILKDAPNVRTDETCKMTVTDV
ncbi:hypothetical protein XENTR_v10018826 [Xenopus tropicalis]|uniref:Uncharacterized LOC108648189 n=1 Tax=Xenopus tropicalis TaxID=8364 RepID=A0A803JRN7_XENTR|nr:uncharacterized protein LOC108648189 [Xenopus tropicalis]XP_031762316.1 uncharacterized protein LOC108648189 [Xenopus tropicalis]KAE8592632.1 hypothetical protein XENTR_v10018826 [Xenopus tropicalis]